MKTQKKGDEELPPEVQAQVDKVREEEGGDELEQQAIEPEPERVRLPGRRARKEEERQAELAAAAERAEKLESTLEELRRQREEDSRQLAEMRGMLTAGIQSRTTTTTDQQPSAPELPGWYRKEIEEAEKDLSEGRVSKYHERIGGATMKLADERAAYHKSQIQVSQQRPEKPAWVSAIEGKYSDVVLHKHGIKTVLYHAELDDRPASPEKLEAAYQAARKTLGLERQESNPADNQRKRQMLSGGSVNGGTGRSNGGKPNGEKYVNVPKNYKEIAARAGMSPEAYIKAYADMNPGEITS